VRISRIVHPRRRPPQLEPSSDPDSRIPALAVLNDAGFEKFRCCQSPAEFRLQRRRRGSVGVQKYTSPGKHVDADDTIL